MTLTDLSPAEIEAWEDLSKATLASQAAKVTNLAQLAEQLDRIDPQGAAVLGPGVPYAPTHPEETEPRRWDYQPGYNVQPQPRAWEPISFNLLRTLCDNYDVARLAIEKRKDDMRGLRWHIEVAHLDGLTRAESKARRDKLQPAIDAVTEFWSNPNQEDPWAVWLTQLLEEIFTIDAPAIFQRQTRSGGAYAAEVVDGSTIRPIIDVYGRRPEPPLPAYGQVIRGTTWQLYTTDELLYAPYWQRSDSPYGHPPMEWVLLSVNRALRRQTLDLSRFTEGNLPIAFYKVPEDFSTAQIKELQELMDELLAGNDIARSRIRFVPGGANTGLEPLNPEPKNEAEEWLMQITAAAYGVTPMELGFMPRGAGLGGKGFAEHQQEVSRDRAKIPLARHVEGICTQITHRHLGQPELLFVIEGLDDESDELEEAKRDQIYVQIGKISVDELRERDDQDPIGLGHYIETPQGPVLVSDLLAEAQAGGVAGTTPPAVETPDKSTPPEGSGPMGAGQDEGQAGADAMAKASADLVTWERKAIRRVRLGKDPSRFASETIPGWQHAFLEHALAGVDDVGEVRAAFRLAKASGGESADPFRRLASQMRDRSSAGSGRPGSATRAATSPAGSAS